LVSGVINVNTFGIVVNVNKGIKMNHLEIVEVKSKLLKNIIWDHKHNYMMVKFTDSPLYIYPDVTRDMFDKLLKAESKGKFFLNIIKKQFPKFIRLDN
jgi:hypothetical protein